MPGFGIFMCVIGTVFILAVFLRWEAITAFWELAIIEGLFGDGAGQIACLLVGAVMIVFGINMLMGH